MSNFRTLSEVLSYRLETENSLLTFFGWSLFYNSWPEDLPGVKKQSETERFACIYLFHRVIGELDGFKKYEQRRTGLLTAVAVFFDLKLVDQQKDDNVVQFGDQVVSQISVTICFSSSQKTNERMNEQTRNILLCLQNSPLSQIYS